MEGSIPAGYVSNLAIAPDNSRFYVSETYWAHGARGNRQDLVSIYDARTLNLLKEISLPGRALVEKMQNFDINASGSRAYVYIMMPVASVVWVDLKGQAVGGTVEIPGCALVFPWGDAGFSSLCGDGSLATVTIPASGPAKVTHTKPFFDANSDPIFENSFVDRATGKAIFLSYTRPRVPGPAGGGYQGERAMVHPEGGRLCAGGYRRAGARMAPGRRSVGGLP